jgi:integrase
MRIEGATDANAFEDYVEYFFWLLRFLRAGGDGQLWSTQAQEDQHTCDTLMLSQGVNPKIAQERLGHSTIAQKMDTYSHELPYMQDQDAIVRTRSPL